MTIRKFALAGVAAAAFAGLAGGEALAFTHHPSTPAERAETRRLNEQALQNAQNGGTMNASTNAATQGSYNNGTMGANGSANGAMNNGPNGSYNNGTMGANGAMNSTNNGDPDAMRSTSGANTTPGAAMPSQPTTPSGSNSTGE